MSKRMVFDASIHLGQFCLSSEDMRIACKNSQALISPKGKNEVIGVCSFNENSWVDHVIWDLKRDEQDIFYPFMDIFHSVKQIVRVPLSDSNVRLAEKIKEDIGLPIADAMTCAVAVEEHAEEIHTLNTRLLGSAVVQSMKTTYDIRVMQPPKTEEQIFEHDVEKRYQDALLFFRQRKIDLSHWLAESL